MLLLSDYEGMLSTTSAGAGQLNALKAPCSSIGWGIKAWIKMETNGTSSPSCTTSRGIMGCSSYGTHRSITDQILQRTKILSFQSGHVTFKDSCFLPFPLANFSATFGIEELCKEFFLHKFNMAKNQDYEGPMPDPSYYDPDGMSTKKKVEYEWWYAAKVAANYWFVLRR